MATTLKRFKVPDKAEFQKLTDRLRERWVKGKPIVRELNEIRIYSCLSVFNGCVFEDMPTGSCLLQDKVNPISRKFQAVYSAQSEPNAILNATFAFLTNEVLLQSDTPNYFRVSSGLMAALMSTELRGVFPEDIQMPFPGFYLEIPKGFFCWKDPSTGYHPIELIGLADMHKGVETKREKCSFDGGPIKEGWALGYRLLMVLHGSANENSKHPADDGCGFFSIPLHTPGTDIDAMADEDEELGSSAVWADLQCGKIGDHKVDGRQLRRALRHFVLNFLLYLVACPEDVRHKNEDAIAKLKEARKSKGKNFGKGRLHKLESDRTYIVGSAVHVDRDQAEYGRSGGVYAAVKFRSVVRGHWRRQPYGPKRAKRKMIWIKPHSRGGDAEKVFGHNYVVR